MDSNDRSPQAQKPKRLHLRPGDYGRKSQHPRSSIGAASGLTGIVALFFGATLSVGAWLAGQGSSGTWLHRIGVALLLLAIPLLAFGAHCFDCVDRESKVGMKNMVTRKGKD